VKCITSSNELLSGAVYNEMLESYNEKIFFLEKEEGLNNQKQEIQDKNNEIMKVGDWGDDIEVENEEIQSKKKSNKGKKSKV